MTDTPDVSSEPRTIDLDAARAARAEQVGPGPRIRLGGITYDLPPELPMEAILQVAEGLLDASMAQDAKPEAVRLALKAVLGEHYDTLRTQLSAQDSMTLLTGILALYGTSLPEASASAPS